MKARILVVDDEAGMLRSVERVLRADHEVLACASSTEAARLSAEFRPHLALVDIRMPEMDGFELLNVLKRQDEDVQVILMTGSIYDVDDQLIRALREKAFYYLNKPFDRQVLRTLVDRCLEMLQLEDANRRHVAHLEGQLEEARALQETMLPPARAVIAGLEIRAEYRPCVELAGDLYVYADAGEGRVALLIADVVGHGASAAMLTSVVKSAFHASREEEFEPSAVVRRVSEGIASFPADRFVTLLTARASRDRLEFVNAGHEGGLVRGPGGGSVDLATTGPMVCGALDLGGWKTETVELGAGASVLLFTDGITETRRGDEEFGTERLRDLLMENRPEDLLPRILEAAERFGGGQPALDDRTLLLAAAPERQGPRNRAS